MWYAVLVLIYDVCMQMYQSFLPLMTNCQVIQL